MQVTMVNVINVNQEVSRVNVANVKQQVNVIHVSETGNRSTKLIQMTNTRRISTGYPPSARYPADIFHPDCGFSTG